MTPETWNAICPAVWAPYQEDKCPALRCTACAPVVMVAHRVCERAHGLAGVRMEAADPARAHKCLQEVMSEGFCNYCIADLMI